MSQARQARKSSPGTGSRATFLYLAAAVLTTFVYFLLPEIAQNILYIFVAASAMVVTLVGARWQPAGRKLPLYLLAVGLLMAVVGEVIYMIYEDVLLVEDPFPSLADVFFIANYPFFAAALVLLIRRRTPGRDWGGITDAAIITTGVGVLSWIFLMKPYADDLTLPLGERLLSISYPLMDLLLLAIAARLLVGPGARVPAYHFIGLSLMLYLIADTVYVALELTNAYEGGHSVDAVYLLSYVLIGAAALHPSMPSLSEPGPDPETKLTGWRLVLFAAAALAAPGALAVQAARGEPIETPVVVGGSVILCLLVLVRLAGFVRRYERAVIQERILRRAGAALVRALNREGIHAAALEAALELMKNEPRPRAYIATVADECLIVEAATGDAADEGVRGARVDLRELPDPAYAALLEMRPVELRGTHVPALGQSPDGDTAAVLLCPLAGVEKLGGALVAVSGSRFSEELKEAFETLGSQVSLALESVALAEDLHQRRSEARFRSLIQNASDIIAILEESGVVRYVSPAVEKTLGYRPEELVDQNLFDYLHGTDAKRMQNAFFDGFEVTGFGPRIEFRMRHADGTWRYLEASGSNRVEDPDVRGFVLNCRDNTERRTLEKQLAHQAFHDSLTGLPNRALFMDRTERALTRARRRKTAVAILFMDLDNFKIVNDSLGHEVGDRLLIAVAERIMGSVRPEDTVARFGGDEFTVLLEDAESAEEATRVAARVARALRASFFVAGQEVFVTTSIGISLNRSTEEQPGDLLKNADLAMYRAKAKGKDGFEVFEPDMNARVLERLELENDLRRALESPGGELEVYYQPEVSAASGEIVGFEALVRWEHPERGLILPSQFVSLAEETGSIASLGRWVLREACRQAREWQAHHPGGPPLLMSVNLSVRQLRRPGLIGAVAEVLQETGLDPGTLVLEITESVAMEDASSMVGTMRELKALGIGLAIDDFGTGHTSLSYLKRFPVDYLKIDRTFTEELGESTEGNVIIEAIIRIAHALGLKVLTEGVEDAGQLARLRELGCDLAQGHHFSEPLPARAASELLTRGRGL